MSADRLQHLFAEALDLEPGQLEPFLLRECGTDAALLQNLRALLDADKAAQSNSIWDASVLLPAPDDPPLIGRKIGPYRVLAVIGAGGMGTVYRAIREDAE